MNSLSKDEITVASFSPVVNILFGNGGAFSIFGLIAPSIIIQFISTTSMHEYFRNLFTALSFRTITISIIKSIVFGMIISGCATLYGFNTGRASTEIPMAGLKAVTKSFVFLILAYAFITAITYIF